MDNLVLTSAAFELRAVLDGALLEDLRQESATRFRLRFALAAEDRSVVISMRAELPWIGAPSRRFEGPRWSPDPFAVAAAKALAGRRVGSVRKLPSERALVFRFGQGHTLVVELATHGGNLILLDAGERVLVIFRRSRSVESRLVVGAPYRSRGLPPGCVDPGEASAEAVDAELARRRADGADALEALRRGVWGIGTAGAELVLLEAERTGETPGAVLVRRLSEVDRGAARPVIEAPEQPWSLFERGDLDPAQVRLQPWTPPATKEGCLHFEAGGALATAGLYYECLEASAHLRARSAGLAAILRAERARALDGARRAREGAAGFGDPESHARRAEALLAGLSVAQRTGERVVVPNPYEPEGPPVVIDAPAGVPLSRLASDLYAKQKRARRGIDIAGARAVRLEARARELDQLLVRHESARAPEGVSALEAEMRALGLPVGLARSARAARVASASSAPAMVGVRMVESAEGLTILVGRTGKDNDRLTFKIASPEDVWLHAQGVPGAHVVVRVGTKAAAVPEGTLREAAQLAAWFSDARGSALVDVQWTRRKHVRRARGAGAGTVIVKKSQTIRVRPVRPPLEEG